MSIGDGFSTGHERPLKSDIEKQNEAEWEQYGAFVPVELRETVDGIFNMINHSPVSFEDLDEDKKTKFVNIVRQYIAIPVKQLDASTKRKELQKEIKKLLS
ncbi:MAG: hypothetical protein WCG28_04485 [bacterium]